MKIKEVAEALERFAPLPLQESYDNAGLQIGLTGCEDVSGVLLCLDVTEQVILEAERLHCNLIVSHHPLLFRPLKHLTMDTQVGRCAMMAVQRGIAVYSAHTNLDNAPGGVNFEMARRLGLHDVMFLSPNASGNGGSGVIGDLAGSMTPRAFLQKVKDTFGVKQSMHNVLSDMRPIKRVALCGGAGEFLLGDAVKQGADAFLTGEMSYHHYFGREDEILIAVIGHFESERYTVDLLHDILRDSCPGLRLEMTSVNTNPIDFF